MGLTVSVILPTHDRPAQLGAAVDSIMAQSHLPDQLIVIDDGTRPAKPDIDRWAKKNRVSFVYERRTPPCLPASRNLGLARADGDIVVFGEDDVVWPGDYLQRLVQLYEADPLETVAGIGAVVTEADEARLSRRAFDWLASALGRGRWVPRRSAARYAKLPEALRGKLFPAARLSGGAMSLRTSALGETRFDESMAGYALGEDREFCYRFGQENAIYVAPSVKVFHHASVRSGQNMTDRGRMYAANTLHIARSGAGGGAGTWLLACYELAGAVVLYLLWAGLSRDRGFAQFVAGIVSQLLSEARDSARAVLCG